MRSRSVSVQSVHCSLSLFVFIWSVGVSVVVLRDFGVGVVVEWPGVFCSCGSSRAGGVVSCSFCFRRRAKRLRLARRSCAMVASLFVRGVRVRDVLLVVVIVVALVGLGVESVVIGGCGRGCRLFVKRPCRNMFGLGRHCSRRSRGAVVAGVGFGSRGGGS